MELVFRREFPEIFSLSDSVNASEVELVYDAKGCDLSNRDHLQHLRQLIRKKHEESIRENEALRVPIASLNAQLSTQVCSSTSMHLPRYI